jgi:hypothetical protein
VPASGESVNTARSCAAAEWCTWCAVIRVINNDKDNTFSALKLFIPPLMHGGNNEFYLALREYTGGDLGVTLYAASFGC